MKITFEVDENFVEYYLDLGWSKSDIKKLTTKFIEKVVLEEVDESNDLVFMTKFDDFLQQRNEEELENN
jgi:hypothetical protein